MHSMHGRGGCASPVEGLLESPRLGGTMQRTVSTLPAGAERPLACQGACKEAAAAGPG